MFDQLEKRGTVLCIAIPLAIIVLGRTFGGSLLGLIPLAFCVTSGVWLWVQEVIKSGKEMEWSSEQMRGQMVQSPPLSINAFIFPHADQVYSQRPLRTYSQNLSNG